MSETIQIKRYPNRRFYARHTSRYVSLAEIEEMIQQGHTVEIRDSQTGEDLTRSVLTQIIMEQHPDKMKLFPVDMLHLILRSNDLMSDFLRDYFRQSLTYLDYLQKHNSATALVPPTNWFKAWLDAAAGLSNGLRSVTTGMPFPLPAAREASASAEPGPPTAEATTPQSESLASHEPAAPRHAVESALPRQLQSAEFRESPREPSPATAEPRLAEPALATDSLTVPNIMSAQEKTSSKTVQPPRPESMKPAENAAESSLDAALLARLAALEQRLQQLESQRQTEETSPEDEP
jgi:polyhydroxyalkanoate synthesis repressor PhaR